MQDHATGKVTGNRQGSLQTAQTFSFTYGVDTSAAAKKLCTIQATTDQPALYRVTAVVGTAFDSAVSATLSVGTDSGGSPAYSNNLSAVDAKAAAPTNYVNANPWRKVTADTDLYGVLTLSGATTAGQVDVIVEIIELNVLEPTPLGS